MPQEIAQSLKLLYCYAPRDWDWLEEIDGRLKKLKHECRISSQFDGELLSGTEQKEKLLTNLSGADVAVLLVSAHFQKVASVWDEISHEAWKVRWLGGCRVIVLLLEPVEWSAVPFATRDVLPRTARPSIHWRKPEPVAHLKVFPADVRAITAWPDREQAFQEIEQGLRGAIEKQWLARGDYVRDEGGGTQDTKALAAYTEALRLNPAIGLAWYGKAHVLVGLDRYTEALEACKEALRLDPQFPWAWFVKGNALAGLHRYKEALEAYHEALWLDPSNNHFWHWQEKALKALEKKRETI